MSRVDWSNRARKEGIIYCGVAVEWVQLRVQSAFTGLAKWPNDLMIAVNKLLKQSMEEWKGHCRYQTWLVCACGWMTILADPTYIMVCGVLNFTLCCCLVVFLDCTAVTWGLHCETDSSLCLWEPYIVDVTMATYWVATSCYCSPSVTLDRKKGQSLSSN